MSQNKTSKKKNQKNEQPQKSVHTGYRIGALILCAAIIVSLVAMYAFI